MYILKKFEYNVSDADVDAEVRKLLERDAKDNEVSDRPCKLNDTVNIDFSGSVDGEKFPGGTADGYDLVLGSGSFIPGFEDGVVGLKVGESKDINVRFQIVNKLHFLHQLTAFPIDAAIH